MSKLSNISALRDHAIALIESVENGMDIKTAAVIGGAYNQIINTLKIQLDYAKACDKKPSIPFLEVNKTHDLNHDGHLALENKGDEWE